MTIDSGFTHWKWWFSIVMLVYQRVIPIAGLLQRFCYTWEYPFDIYFYPSIYRLWVTFVNYLGGASWTKTQIRIQGISPMDYMGWNMASRHNIYIYIYIYIYIWIYIYIHTYTLYIYTYIYTVDPKTAYSVGCTSMDDGNPINNRTLKPTYQPACGLSI